MLTTILFCVLAGISSYRLYKFMFTRPPNFPPGPPRIPFFDSYLLLLMVNYKHMHKAADALCKYYKTNILGLYFAATPTIILNDAATVKKALYNREYDGKPLLKLAELRDPEFNIRGVFFTEGALWKEQRRYMLRYLRDFGFGRRFQELELETREEFQIFIDIVNNGPKYEHEKVYFRNNCVLAPLAFCPYIVNVFMKTVFSERVPRHDMHIFNEIIDATMEFQRKGDAYGRLFSHVPSFGNLFPKWTEFDKLRDASMEIHQFIKKLIDEQVATYDSNFERSFIDMYLNEIKKAGDVNDTDTTYTYEQLIMMVLDFFIPAFTAIATQVTHLLHVLCSQPEIQMKIHNEIDEVVGHGRLPSLDDRTNLPYTEACIREIMRYVTLAPSGIPHKSLEDTQFMGYDIPKGSFVITSLYSSHRDPTVWPDADTFMPDRFIDEKGKLCLNKDQSLPFGAGKRLCAGETFARNTMFLFVTAVLQSFTINVPNWEKLPSISELLTGIIVSSRDFWLEFEPRKWVT